MNLESAKQKCNINFQLVIEMKLYNKRKKKLSYIEPMFHK